jgi:TPR repeat protein
MTWLGKLKITLQVSVFAAAAGVSTPSVVGFGVANGSVPSNGTSSLNQSSTIQVYSSALRGDAGAVAILRHRARGSNAVAEALLGDYYLSHRNAKAFTWLSKASAQNCAVGNHAAQAWLGLCYFNGIGTKRNYPAAEKLWRLAANGGNALAAYELGCIYETGTGLTKNPTKALDWFKTATADGQPNVTKAARSHMQHISLILAEKLIQSGHYPSAFRQLMSPASQGNAAADYLLGNLYAAGHSPLGRKIQPQLQAQMDNLLQTATAGEKALKALKHYAKSGDMHAQYALAIWDEHSGRILQALSWLSSAAHYPVVGYTAIGDMTTGDPTAQYRLATLLFSGSYNGTVIPVRPPLAHREGRLLLKAAAQRGYLKAEALLGGLYFGQPDAPNIIFPNRKKAKFWLTKAAAQGDKHAAALLAVMAKGGGPRTKTFRTMGW